MSPRPAWSLIARNIQHRQHAFERSRFGCPCTTGNSTAIARSSPQIPSACCLVPRCPVHPALRTPLRTSFKPLCASRRLPSNSAMPPPPLNNAFKCTSGEGLSTLHRSPEQLVRRYLERLDIRSNWFLRVKSRRRVIRSALEEPVLSAAKGTGSSLPSAPARKPPLLHRLLSQLFQQPPRQTLSPPLLRLLNILPIQPAQFHQRLRMLNAPLLRPPPQTSAQSPAKPPPSVSLHKSGRTSAAEARSQQSQCSGPLPPPASPSARPSISRTNRPATRFLTI